MPDMSPTLLAAAVTPHTGKIIKNGICVFEIRLHYIKPVLRN